MSEALSTGTRKRISRIRRRAIPEVLAAYEAGQISAKRADLLLYLPSRQQRKQLTTLLDSVSNKERRCRMAAEVIEQYLANREGPIDLQAVAGEIRAAVA